jgi:hypothetical protein
MALIVFGALLPAFPGSLLPCESWPDASASRREVRAERHFHRIKGFFAQRLEPFSRYNDLVNLFEDASQLPPVLIRHTRKAGIPGDPGVDDRRPIHELRP